MTDSTRTDSRVAELQIENAELRVCLSECAELIRSACPDASFWRETLGPRVDALLSGESLGETWVERWLRLGYRVEWSEREPRMYEVRCVGSLPADNTCLARLPTVQDVDAWIAERVKGER